MLDGKDDVRLPAKRFVPYLRSGSLVRLRWSRILFGNGNPSPFPDVVGQILLSLPATVSGTTSITPPGDFNSCAFAFAAAMTRSAPSSVRVFFSAVWPKVTEPERSHTARNTILRKVILILFLCEIVDGRPSIPIGTTAHSWSCGPNYITGELKLASPRLTSAKAHQMTTFLTFFT